MTGLQKGERIGFTTTIPVEILLSAGAVPVDLNNTFIGHPKAAELVSRAEADGYPRSLCSWIKGIYGAVRQLEPVDRLLFVTEGDCSNTIAMRETFRLLDGPPLMSFRFPHDRSPDRLKAEMEQLSRELDTTIRDAEQVRQNLVPLRRKLRILDELTWKSGLVSGEENHSWLVSSSDFGGDPVLFESRLDDFLEKARGRPEKEPWLRLAFCGVPPIFQDLYSYLSSCGAEVVLNEMQRQFSMPYECDTLLEQYLMYTYPYDVFFRLEDLKRELEQRRIHGVIHYVQSFCHRGIEDVVLRKELPLPVLTLEGDAPGKLDERTRLRIDIFLEMLSDRV